MKKIAFTSITTNYLPKARVLAHSVKRHASEVSFVLVVAEPFDNSLLRPDDPFDRIITVEELGIPALHQWLFTHTIVEGCTAIKGHSIVKLLDVSEDTAVLYFDPDIVVTYSLDGLFAEFENASILLTPHGTEPEKELRAIIDNEISHLRYGVYNLGFIAVRNTKVGRRFAGWWAQRLHDFCYEDIESGIFTDQRWADLAPAFFESVKVLRDPGYNVATWNLSHRVVKGSLSKGFRANERPLVFYHFSGFDSGAMETMLSAYGAKSPGLQRFRRWYIQECEKMGQAELGSRPWLYSKFDSGEPITKAQRRLYRDRNDLQVAFENPFSTRGSDSSFLDWYRRHGLQSSAKVIANEPDYQIIVMALDGLGDVEESLHQLLAHTANKSCVKIVGALDLCERLATVAPGAHLIQASADITSGAGREAWMLAQIADCKAPGLIFVHLGLDLPELWDLRLTVGARRESSIISASPLYDGASLTALSMPEMRVMDTNPEDIDRVICNLDNRIPLESPNFLRECFYVDTVLAQSILGPSTQTKSGKQRCRDLSAFARDSALAGFSHVILNDLYVGGNPLLGHQPIPARRHCQRVEQYEGQNRLSEIRSLYNQVAREKTLDLPTVAQRASRRHLHISHAWGGGLAHWIRSYCVSDTEHINMVLRPVGGAGANGCELELYADIDAPSPLARWQLPIPIKATVVRSLTYKRIIESIVANYGIDVVFVSTLIGHSMDVLTTGITTIFICHDFFPLTPDIYIRSRHLSGNRVINFSLGDVFERGGLSLFANFSRAQAKAATQGFNAILAKRQIKLVAPSPSTRQIYLDLASGLHPDDISVIPHGTVGSFLAETRPAYSPEGRLRIVVPGRIAPEKGMALLATVLPTIGEFADVLLVGSGHEGQSLADIDGVQVISRYDPEDLPAIMRDYQPHLGLLLSDFAETFSYTLDELFAMGIPPVAVRIGALADRIREGENGFLVDNHSQGVLQMLRGLDHNRHPLVCVRRVLETTNPRTEADMIRDYEFLFNLPRFSSRALDAPSALPPSAYSYVLPWKQPAQAATTVISEILSGFGSDPYPANAPISNGRRLPFNFRSDALRPRRRLAPREYLKLISRIRETVDAHVPPKAIVAVVSKGDEQLLYLHKRCGCHFPQVGGGIYAGHHPANSAEAIAHIEALRSRGVEYLLFPSTAFWWFDHYREFTQHLETKYRQLVREEKTCAIYALADNADPGPAEAAKPDKYLDAVNDASG